MKKLLFIPVLALPLLCSCSSSPSSSASGFGGTSEGYFNSTSARSGHPMHWRKRNPVRLSGGSGQAAQDPMLSQLTEEDIENIKKLRKSN